MPPQREASGRAGVGGGSNTNTHTNTTKFQIKLVKSRPFGPVGRLFSGRGPTSIPGFEVCAETERPFLGSLLFAEVFPIFLLVCRRPSRECEPAVLGGGGLTPQCEAAVSGGETPKLLGRQWRWMYITRGDLPLQKTFFLSRNLAEPVADAPLCCARAPAHRHVAPRRPRSELLTWQRLHCPKGSCIGKRGEGRWWVRSPANSRTSFQRDKRMIERSVPSLLDLPKRLRATVRTVQETRYQTFDNPFVPLKNWPVS